jgi:hypothetical protein
VNVRVSVRIDQLEMVPKKIGDGIGRFEMALFSVIKNI